MEKRTLEIRFHSALHHGSGFGLAGIIDRTVLRDSKGMPYLAGSALKGRLRHAALRLLLATGQPACQYGDQKAICEGPNPCAVCALFGSPRYQGQLFISDAYPPPETRRLLEVIEDAAKEGILHRDSSVRAGTSIDRMMGTVKAERLFSTETLPSDLVFESSVYGDPGKNKSVLQQACRVLTHFGADAARGLGRCTYSLRGAA